MAGMDDEILEQQISRLAALVERMVDSGVTQQTQQTVIHKTEGMSHWASAAVVACFATWFALILFAMEIHDLRAWRDIHAGKISKLEAQKEPAK